MRGQGWGRWVINEHCYLLCVTYVYFTFIDVLKRNFLQGGLPLVAFCVVVGLFRFLCDVVGTVAKAKIFLSQVHCLPTTLFPGHCLPGRKDHPLRPDTPPETGPLPARFGSHSPPLPSGSESRRGARQTVEGV